ncbi:MAG: V-type ATP synthase subunit I [Clostridiales bacterium]|jgi:V/A-type H+-transporting ATPase subunit I|nr:V-type ATP synthase subunit I [Clostridiales bacterium]
MSIVKMSKVSLVGHLADRERLIARVMKLGLVEVIAFDSRNGGEEVKKLVSPDNADEKAARLESDMSRVGAALGTLERFFPEKTPMFFSGKEMKVDQYKTIVNEFETVWESVGALTDIESRLAALQSEENRQNSLLASLTPWQALPLPLEQTETRTTRIQLGVVPAGVAQEALIAALAEAAPESFIENVSADAELCYIVAVCHRPQEETASQVLKQYGFARVQFKELLGTPDSNMRLANERIAEIKRERAELEQKAGLLAPQKIKLQVLYDYLEIRAERQKIVAKLGRSDSAFYLEGWLPTKAVPGFCAKITSEADCYIETTEPEKGEDHPILLENPKLVRPFEAVTQMYSLPSARDIDPNILMAPFYFLFFGMMIGDFAYGILLAAAIGIMIKKFKPRGTAGKILNMLFLGGLSTALWGMIFGSYFGNITSVLPNWLGGGGGGAPATGIAPLWFDPSKDPMKMLIFSMIFGTFHLFVGMGIKMYMLFRDGKPFEAIFDVGSWYLVIVGLPLFALGITVAGLPIGLYTALLGVAMLVLTQGRSSKNPFMKLMNGIMSLYGITGYLGDILSYSRLLALGLATGVIAAVINTLATLNAPGFISAIVFLVIVAFGTVFNIAINALGAFVHSSRLQYVEFFSKFYEGGGEAFQPFEIKTKYIKII